MTKLSILIPLIFSTYPFSAEASTYVIFCEMETRETNPRTFSEIYMMSGEENGQIFGSNAIISEGRESDEVIISDISEHTLLILSLTEHDNLEASVEGLFLGEPVVGLCSDITQEIAALTTQPMLCNENDLLREISEQRTALVQANNLLSQERALFAETQRQVALLNQQITALRQQLNALRGLLDASAEADQEAQAQLAALGGDLNSALARLASEQKARAELEARELERLKAGE